MIATAMQAADSLIVNVALPRLELDLGGGVEFGAWIITAYLCATAVAAPLTAWLRRRYGALQLWKSVIGVFVVSSLLCALAPAAAYLILFRVFQGAAGGIILPLGQALLLDLYPRQRHGRILAAWGAVTMVGPIVGPLLGGFITDLSSWRWVFAINLPFGVFGILSMRPLRLKFVTEETPRIDAFGFFLLMVAIGGLQLCLERGVGRTWVQSPELPIEGLVTFAAFTTMILRARSSGFTVFRLTVFKDVNFSLATFYNFMNSGLLFVTVVFLPALVQGPFGYSATVAGFTIVPRAVIMTLVMLLVGRLIGKVPYRILLLSGWFLMAAGLALLSVREPKNAIAWLIAGSTIQAIGAGMLFTPHSTLAYSTLLPDLRTDASGVYSLLRQLGFASGVALMTAVLRTRIETNMGYLGSDSVAYSPMALMQAAAWRSYSQCFLTMAFASLLISPGVFLFRIQGEPAVGGEPTDDA